MAVSTSHWLPNRSWHITICIIDVITVIRETYTLDARRRFLAYRIARGQGHTQNFIRAKMAVAAGYQRSEGARAIRQLLRLLGGPESGLD